MNYLRGELPRRLADDYVLGTMQGPARRRFERLQREHWAFGEARREAESRWNLLAEALEPVQPSASVWDNIQARIDPPTRADQRGSAKATTFWRVWAVAASLIAVVLVFPALERQQPRTEYVVVITHDVDATAGWFISLREGGSIVKVESLHSHELPGDRVFQLWVKSPTQTQVRSVGLISATGEIELQATGDLQQILSSAVLFGVSVEPPGGSPTGQPTTTPLFHGKPRPVGS